MVKNFESSFTFGTFRLSISSREHKNFSIFAMRYPALISMDCFCQKQYSKNDLRFPENSCFVRCGLIVGSGEQNIDCSI